MPGGGLFVFGSGLRLQGSTPGETDSGNFNVDGVGIAGRFSTSTANIGNQSELFGHNLTCPGDNGGNVLVGNSLSTSTGNTGPYVIFGFNNSATGQGNVALGIGCQSGPTPATGYANNVAIGKDCVAGATAADGGNRVALGYQCSASGGQNVAVGRSVNLANTNLGGSVADSVAFGAAISIGAGSRENAIFGLGASPAGRANVLAMGYWTGAVGAYPASGPGQENNSILIGNDLQTSVKIGPYRIGAGVPGATATVADANKVIQAGESTIIYTSIAAARTVTLQAANAVPAGSVVRVVDMSGSAGAVNTITTVPAGADTIVGPGTAAISTAYGSRRFMSDGVSKWNCCTDF